MRARADTRGIGMTSQRARDRLVERLREMGIGSEAVLEVIRRTPRHLFVDEALASRAYENTALPIGHGQTISQPFMVARIAEAALAAAPLGRVLEVGGGCGYQAAVLAGLARRVYTIERIGMLATRLRERLHRLGIHNVRVRHGDGAGGWPREAPFDAIVVSAAATAVPPMLLEQLSPRGCLVAPVGARGGQQLVRVRREGAEWVEERLGAATFVPLRHGMA